MPPEIHKDKSPIGVPLGEPARDGPKVPARAQNAVKDEHEARGRGAFRGDESVVQIHFSQPMYIAGASAYHTSMTKKPTEPKVRRFAKESLAKAEFDDVDLAKAKLHNVDLKGAELDDADMSGARVHNVAFTKAEFDDVTLEGARIHNASFKGAELDDVTFEGASIKNADLSGSKWSDIKLAGARIDDADLSGVELTDCKIEGLSINGVRIDTLLAEKKS